MALKTISYQQPVFDPRQLQQFIPTGSLEGMPWLPEFRDPSRADGRLPIEQSLLQQGMDTSPTIGGPLEGLTRVLAGTLGGYWKGQSDRKRHGIEDENRALIQDVLANNDTEDPRVAASLLSSPDPLAQALGKALMERIPTRGEEELLGIRREGLEIQRRGLEDEASWRQRSLDLQEGRDLDAVSESVTDALQRSNVLAETRESNIQDRNLKREEMSQEVLDRKAQAALLARGATGTRVQSSKDLGDGRILVLFDDGTSGIVTDQGLQKIDGPMGIGDVPAPGAILPGRQGALAPTGPQVAATGAPPNALPSTNAPSAVQNRALAQWRGKNRAERELNLPKAQAALADYESNVEFVTSKIDELTGTFDATKKDDPATPTKEGTAGDQGMIGRWSTGPLGFIGKNIPFMSTPGGELDTALDVLRANISFDTLQRMRASSPTGGALGNVTDQEIKYLQSTMGSLDQIRNDPERLRKTLREIKQRMLDFRTMRQQAFEQDYGDIAIPLQGIGVPPQAPPPPPPPAGVPLGNAGGGRLDQFMQRYGVQ